MPDLAVHFDATRSVDAREAGDRMVDVLSEGGPFKVVRRDDPCITAVNLLKPFSFAPDQPFQRDGEWLMIDGALYRDFDLDELWNAFASGDPARLNGQFNAVAYRPAEKRLFVITDRLGSRTLYHGASGTRHVVASEIKAVLAGLDRTFDLSPVGLIELFAFGHNVGDRTVLEGITALPPGSIITIDESGMRATPYYKYRYRPAHEGSSPAEVGERISACVKETARAYLDGPARKGFFLSGGLDSRIVAGAIGEVDPAMHAYTFGYPESRDVVFAAELARRLHYEHHVLTYPDVYLSQVIRDVVARTECAAPFYHATSILFHETVARHADAILVGFCGDVFSGGHLRPAMFKLPPGPELTGLIFDRALCAGKDGVARIFRPEALERYWPLFVESFRASVDSIRGQSGPDTADVWDVENRQRRFTFSAPKVDRRRFEVVAPLIDNRFVDLVTTLPVRARRRQIAYRHAIVSGYPGLSSVPWAATGRPIELNPFKDRVQETARLGSKAFRRVLARLGLRAEGLEWQFRNIAEEMRRDEALFNEHLDPFLDSDRFPEDLFSRQGIRDLVKMHRSGADASHLLGTLLTVAVFTDLI